MMLPSTPEDGQNYCLKHVELIEIVNNKLLLLHLVGFLYSSFVRLESVNLKYVGLLLSGVKLLSSG